MFKKKISFKSEINCLTLIRSKYKNMVKSDQMYYFLRFFLLK